MHQTDNDCIGFEWMTCQLGYAGRIFQESSSTYGSWLELNRREIHTRILKDGGEAVTIILWRFSWLDAMRVKRRDVNEFLVLHPALHPAPFPKRCSCWPAATQAPPLLERWQLSWTLPTFFHKQLPHLDVLSFPDFPATYYLSSCTSVSEGLTSAFYLLPQLFLSGFSLMSPTFV